MSTDIRGDTIFHDDVSFGAGVFVPAGSFDDDAISSNANKRIQSSKVVQRVDLNYQQADGVDVATASVLLRLCRGAGKLLDFQVRPTTAPTGGDKKYTVDLQKAADASAVYSTLLDAPITVDNTSVNETKQQATLIASPVTAAGDAIKVIVTASGSTGSQGQGVIVTASYEEAPS